MINNKRGQGLSTSTTILLILGVVILVVLILGFTMGWNKVAPWISKNNVDSVMNSCEIACSQNSIYGYCSWARDLKLEDKKKIEGVTCNFLAEKQTQYGIEKCPEIVCEDIVFVELASGEKLEDKCTDNKGKTVQALIGDTLESYSCPSQ